MKNVYAFLSSNGYRFKVIEGKLAAMQKQSALLLSIKLKKDFYDKIELEKQNDYFSKYMCQ